MRKSTYPTHSFPHNWSSQDLVDAMPRRLSELITPEFMNFDGSDEAANCVAPSPLAFDWRRRAYLRNSELPGFHVR